MTTLDLEAEKAALIAVNAERIRVLVAGDLDALDRFVGDELIYVSPRGKAQTKAQVYEGFRSGAVKVERLDIEDPRARLFGSVGIVTYRANTRIVDGAEVFDAWTQSTAIYHHRDGRFQLVSQHVCEIA